MQRKLNFLIIFEAKRCGHNFLSVDFPSVDLIETWLTQQGTDYDLFGTEPEVFAKLI